MMSGRIGRSIGAAAVLAAFFVPAAAMIPPVNQRLGDLVSILNLPRLAAAFEAPIERIEAIGPGLYRLTAGRCHVDIRMVRVPGGPGEGLGPPRTAPRAGPRICSN
jgi:hypothetical protein